MNYRAFWSEELYQTCAIAYAARFFVCMRYYDRDPFETFTAVFVVEYVFHMLEFGCACDALPLIIFFALWAAMCFLDRPRKTFAIAYALMAMSGCDRPGKTVEDYRALYADGSVAWLILARSRLFAVTLVFFSVKMPNLDHKFTLARVYAVGLLALWIRLYAGHSWASLAFSLMMELTNSLQSKIEDAFL